MALTGGWRGDAISKGYRPPELIHVGDQTWVNVGDLRRALRYRQQRAKDNGYSNALRWMIEMLTEMERESTDE